jgi:hypothetical protein
MKPRKNTHWNFFLFILIIALWYNKLYEVQLEGSKTHT